MTNARRFLLATNNKGKLTELRRILEPLGFEVVSLSDAGLSGEPVEDGETFLDNALIKARYFASHSDIPVIADDSGLCVEALGGEPGVHSRYFGGPEGHDEANNRALVAAVQGLSPEKRGAYYVCVAVCVWPDGNVEHAEGRAEGRIVTEPRGTGGFGYDPFVQDILSGRTFAELSPDEKDERSHRGKAFRALAAKLSR
ncbi:MAG: RdgB/HAM1 family non-canonical purine NTP pyrophosphatase [Deltaproteobacteria bacterium]|nr:RdgB/HAM1 family non-canonical purine NTP pyrophosphatase [Deltaproteobacteria bacterium]MCB9480067.1 RdgB/HAM1 family non-canonical purine NTP pyrophosphatase [Deltaproteobacteria bacterium]MCB9487125.1 RdgB/HAM1 family non-canonical purine NTP pyrophosphatase [Deltaproteobacteria bacterium]